MSRATDEVAARLKKLRERIVKKRSKADVNVPNYAGEYKRGSRDLPCTRMVRIDQIRLGVQPRQSISSLVVDEYADAMLAGKKFRSLDVFWDGTDHWLADGFHRLQAHQKVKHVEVVCSLRQGSRRDAMLFAIAANQEHGLRRNVEDKRRAVKLLLEDEECCQWSDRAVADYAGVSHPLVASVRDEIGEAAKPSARLGKDGKQRKLPARESVPPAIPMPTQLEAVSSCEPTVDEPVVSGPCLKGGDHKWVNDDEGQYCERCCTDHGQGATSVAKHQPDPEPSDLDRQLAKQFDIEVVMLQDAQKLDAVAPELGEKCLAGSLALSDALQQAGIARTKRDLHTSMECLNKALDDIEARWPDAFLLVLAERLIDTGEYIKTRLSAE